MPEPTPAAPPAPPAPAAPTSPPPSPGRTAGPVFDAIDAIEGTDSPESTESNGKTAEPASKPAKTQDLPEKKPDSGAKKPSLGEDLDPIVGKTRPAPESDGDPKTPKQLREAYQKLKEEYNAKELTLKQFESEKSRLREEAGLEARKAIDAELKALKETADERDRRLQMADYRESDDYKTRYETPMKEAWKDAGESLEGAKVTSDDGTTRDVTLDDVAALVRMPAAQAHTTAHEKFGLLASLLLEHRAKILGLEHGRQKALAEFKNKATSLREQQTQTRQRVVDEFKTSVRKFSEDFPELFGPEKGDDEGNTLLDKGDLLVQTAMIGDNLPADMAPEERDKIITNAQRMVAVRARGFGRLYHRYQRLQGENTALKEKLAKLETSEPDPGGGDPEVKNGKGPSLEDAIDALPGFNRY